MNGGKTTMSEKVEHFIKLQESLKALKQKKAKLERQRKQAGAEKNIRVNYSLKRACNCSNLKRQAEREHNKSHMSLGRHTSLESLQAAKRGALATIHDHQALSTLPPIEAQQQPRLPNSHYQSRVNSNQRYIPGKSQSPLAKNASSFLNSTKEMLARNQQVPGRNRRLVKINTQQRLDQKDSLKENLYN